jgi:hypothetical protein
MKYFGGHMAKIIEFYIPQGFRKVSKWFPAAERGKVAGISTGGTKIGVTGAETRTAKLRLSKVKQQS